jgi:hypothetical protein
MLCARVVNLAHDTSIEGDISHRSIAGTVEDVPDARIITITPTDLEVVCMLNPICAQLYYAKINGPKYAFSGIFAYGDPRVQISRAQNVCKSPYANPHMQINTAQTLQQ